MLAYALSFIDRLILSLLVEPIKHDLHLGDFQISLLQGLSFALFYTLAGIPVGRLVDRGSRTAIIAGGIALWSLMTATCGVVRQYWQLFLARAGVGVGEASLAPAAYSLLGDLFPADRRGLALGIFSAGTSVGAGLALIIGGVAIEVISAAGSRTVPWIGTLQPWQLTFIYVGMPGVVVACLVCTIPEPLRHDASSRTQAGASPAVPVRVAMDHFRRHASTIGLHHFAMGMSALASYGILSWAPAMLMRVHGWRPQDAGLMIGTTVLVAGTIGVIAGGAFGDHLLRRGRAAGRLDAAVISMAFGAVGAVTYPFQDSLPALAASFMLAMLGAFMVIGCGAAALLDITPNRLRGQATAVYFFVNSLIGLGAGPTAVAAVTDYIFGAPEAVRYSLAIVPTLAYVMAAVCFWAARAPYRRSCQGMTG
jgi:MFS family permease